MRHVAVIGGGIAGLTAAHALLQGADPPVRVTLLEASTRLGGKIRTESIASHPIDVGAESLMARIPATIELCRELGLEQELIAARETSSSVWTRQRMRSLPPGILGGLPQGLAPVLRSRVLSPTGVARAALDLLLPASPMDGDRSVGEIVERRLGAQTLDRLLDPLLGSIYAADCHALCARATAPGIDRIAREHRSLIRGLRAVRQPGPVEPDPRPLFVTLPGGLQRVVQRLSEELAQGGPAKVEQRLGVRAGRLQRAGGGRYLLDVGDGEPLALDGVVVAAPADQAAIVLRGIAPLAAASLRSIRYASTVVLTLRCPGSAASRPPPGAGFLVPQSERRLLGACTSLSAKWPHLAATGELWLRCSVARASTAGALAMDDETLLARIAGELREAIGLRGEPIDAQVTRWRRSLPRYEPGHLDRVERIEAQLAHLPGVALAGAAYRGMGVPQCIAQGRAAAQRVLAELRDAPNPAPDSALACLSVTGGPA
jgi:protoporphyrinogen/coproporphyrinogen III oxidase